MDDIYNGALSMERAANIKICQDTLGTHLCFATRDRRFREAFGISSESAYILWTYLNVPNEGPAGGQPVHLLWTLFFLKTYNTQNDLAGRCGVHKDTFRVWRNLFLERIASLDDLIDFENRHMLADPHQVCKITVDGTDFWIEEPIPFDTKWYSHKINGPAVRYEVAVCIKTGWIVWINGPFPAGAWPDLNIARHSLIHFLDDGEYYAATSRLRRTI